MAGLTVVVPTIPGRESLLSRCLWSLTSQAAGSVEILVVEGAGRLGDKVNAAATVASGEYLTVVDDDDWVAADYMAAVLPELGPVDYVGLRVLELDNGRFSRITGTSAEYSRWGSRNRGPVPKGVTRTSIWRQVPFGNEWMADRAWMRQASALIGSWAFVDRPLYVYDFWSDTSVFCGAGGARDVGVWPFDDSNVRRLVL